MGINNKIFFIGIIFVFLIVNVSAIRINEVMYNPNGTDSGREWIEIHNDGNENINLTGWKFYEEGSNHGLSLKQGDLILEINEYAIITSNEISFLLDYPNYAGTILDSSWASFSNTEETLALKNSSLDIVFEITYDDTWGANGNGKSLQYCSGSWIEAEPTPGSINSCEQEVENEEDNETINPKNETSSQPIEINYPNQVTVEQEFIFKIKLIDFEVGIYDVKIDILSEGNRISKILNEGSWKSTNYYVENSINSNTETEFSMKITEEFENADITIKIRDLSGNVETFQGYEIFKLNQIYNETIDETNSNIIMLNNEVAPNENNGIIVLNNKEENINSETKDIKSENISKKLDKNDYAKYGIMGFCILLALLFLFKIKIPKKKYKNEFN